MGVRMNDSEQDIIQRINVKDEKAFHDLFMRFRSYLVLFAMRRVGQLEVAEDIVRRCLSRYGKVKKFIILTRVLRRICMIWCKMGV